MRLTLAGEMMKDPQVVVVAVLLYIVRQNLPNYASLET